MNDLTGADYSTVDHAAVFWQFWIFAMVFMIVAALLKTLGD
jgi:hypothetical protein